MNASLFSQVIAGVFCLCISCSCGFINKSRSRPISDAGIIGTIAGATSGSKSLGSILGATVGGIGGSAIGSRMDQLAAGLKAALPGARIDRVGEGLVIEFSSTSMFASNKMGLLPESTGTLDQLVTVLKQYTDTELEIQGHTDNKGTVASNLRLAKSRSTAVAKYLVSKQVNESRIHTLDFGESAPKYDNSTPQGRAANRRVDILISASKDWQAKAAAGATN